MQQIIKTPSGRTLILPPEEDTAIEKNITADTDTYELTDKEFAELKPVGQKAQEQQLNKPLTAAPKSKKLNYFSSAAAPTPTKQTHTPVENQLRQLSSLFGYVETNRIRFYISNCR